MRLSPTRELKTKSVQREELTVEAVIPGCTRSYAGASKGQKKRLDLCLILAFRELVASRANKAFHQLFVDELFDGLDQTGCAGVVELLREMAKTGPVALITHDERIKPAGDRFVLVDHDGTTARIVANGTFCATTAVLKPVVQRRITKAG